jgi:hypothetical protein
MVFPSLLGATSPAFLLLIHTLNVCQLAGASPRPDSSGSGFVFVGDDLKLVLLVRNDLGMSPGKIAAQCCHAALGAQRVNPMFLTNYE